MIKDYTYTTKEEFWIKGTQKPPKYKLVKIRHEDGSTATGWWSGFDWDGLKVKAKEVVSWRKVTYNNSPTKEYRAED